jgi:O-succinylbenzoic acid--CoA ligase
MDPTLLTHASFWCDPRPFAVRDLPDIPALRHHVLFETSGSSGTPKWVALSKSALLASAAAVNHHLQVGPQACWGLALPLHHVGGFGVAARSWHASCRMETFAGKWQPAAFAQWLNQVGVTHTSMVPTQVHDLVRDQLQAPRSLVAIVVGGGRLDRAMGQAARDLGWPVLASYGMTEAASQIATQGLDALAAPYHTAPIPVLPIWQTRTDRNGLLEIAGLALFSGYLLGNTFTPRPSDWHTTSDRVNLTDSGVFPRGRADTRVKVLGELVDPEAIEQQLIELSRGQLTAGCVAVVALADERAENRLVPVFDATVDPAISSEVLALYQQAVPGFLRLAAACQVERMPRSELGKLRRSELATLVARTSCR